MAPLAISNGLFTAQLNFGSTAFTGAARWLEIGVRTNGSPGDFTAVNPRQALLPTPYATLVYFVRLLIDGKLAQAEKLVRDAFIWSHLAGDTVQRLKVAARLARVAAQH